MLINSKKSDSSKTIHQLFKYYAGTVTASSSFLVDEDTETTNMFKEILLGLLSQYVLKATDKTVFWKWAHEIGCGQIDEIVSNKYRNAYGTAAQILECLILTDQQSKAQSLVDTYYKEKYRRYTAFRKEVKAVFKHGVLKGIRL